MKILKIGLIYKYSCLSLLILFFVQSSFAQVGIGTTNPDSKSILDIVSSNKGMLIPRMTKTERDLIQPNGQKGLMIFNTTQNCFNFWNTIESNWESLCGDKFGGVEFSNCASIKIQGVYNSDKPANDQKIKLLVPVKVTAIGSYSYTASVNGITFTAIGNYVSIGPQIVSFIPTSGTPTMPVGTFPATLTVSPTVASPETGVTCTGINIKFISRLASTIKILNLEGDQNYSNLISGGSYNSSSSYGLVGSWLTTNNFPIDGTLGTPHSFAGTNNVTIENFDPTAPGSISSFSEKLKEVSIVWVAASDDYQDTAPAFGTLLNNWINTEQGVVIFTGDKFYEAAILFEMDLFLETGNATDAIPTGQNTMPEVFSAANGAPYTFNSSQKFKRSGSNVGFITSSTSVTIGETEPGGTFGGRTAISGDTSRGVFVFGDKFGETTSNSAPRNDFAKFLVDVFVWSLKNAPVK